MERALSLLATAALAATLAAALAADRGSRACLGGGSRGLRGRWLPRHRLWRLVPSWFWSWSTLLYRLRLFLSWPTLFGLRPLLNWPSMLFGLRLLLSWLTFFGLPLLV